MRELIAQKCYQIFRKKTWCTYNELKKMEYLSLADLKKIQFKKVKNLLEYSYNNVPYYHDLFKKNKIYLSDIKDEHDIEKIPISTKDDFRQGFPHRFVAKNIAQSEWRYHSTSGSSGNPFQFILDDASNSIANARQLRMNDWINFKIGKKQINISGAHHSFSFKKQLNNFILNQKNILSTDAFHEKKIISATENIMKFKPRLIHGYPSAIYTISQFIQEKEFKIDWDCCVTTTSETIMEYQKKIIEQVIGPVYNYYGSREFRAMAQECVKKEGLHVNMESFYLEFIKDNAPLSEGEVGQLIVTGLDNFTMPLIRYEIGDKGSYSNETCSCRRNLVLIKKIEGRITDFITMPSGRKIPFLYFNVLFENCGKYIKNFQVEKKGGHLNIKIVPTEYFTEETKKMIESELKKTIGEELEVGITLVLKLTPEKSGKMSIVKILD